MLTPDYEDLRKYVDFPNMPDDVLPANVAKMG